MSSLADQVDLYYSLVYAHSAVPGAVVESYLGMARVANNESALGARYDEAVVWWAAVRLDPVVASGAFPSDGGCAPETPVDPRKAPARPDYEAFYKSVIASRAATGPFWVGPGC